MLKYFLAILLCVSFVEAVEIEVGRIEDLSAFAQPAEGPVPIGNYAQSGSLPWTFGKQNYLDEQLVEGAINPLTGQAVLQVSDLLAKGAENIVIGRSYSAPLIPSEFLHPKTHYKKQKESIYLSLYLKEYYRGWQTLPHVTLKINGQEIAVFTPYGIELKYDEKGKLISSLYGMSNMGGGSPSAIYDVRNSYLKRVDARTIELYDADGTVRTYVDQYLQKEKLPNGKILRYFYSKKNALERIDSMDPNEHYVYTSVYFSKERAPFILTGLKSAFIYDMHCFDIKFKETVDHVLGLPKKNTIHHRGAHKRLVKANTPFFEEEICCYNERFALTSYKGKDHAFNLKYKACKDTIVRVSSFSSLAGEAYQFEYDPPVADKSPGTTKVIATDGSYRVFSFNEKLLLTKVAFFNKDNSCACSTIYYWTPNQWLQSIEKRDANDVILFKKSFEYDSFGNPILEVIESCLPHHEKHSMHRKFSEDGMHLLLEEQENNRPLIQFTYIPGTNLVETKTTSAQGKISEKITNAYDTCYNLIDTFVEDEVHAYHTRIELCQEGPFLHMPKSIKKDNGYEIKLSYDPFGNVCQEEFYDNEGIFQYAILKEYNKQGLLLSETNALGQKALYTRNARGDLTSKVNFSGRLTTSFTYDPQGLLIHKQEAGENILHSTSYSYTFDHLLEKETDYLGNTTLYTYDPITRKVSSVKDSYGTIFYTYDALGNIASKTDACGFTTKYQCNIYGKPVVVTYPDGSVEEYRYNSKGDMLYHKSVDGIITAYQVDILGRVISKSCGLCKESYVYSEEHLLSYTDREGNKRNYFYNSLGRKIKEEFCGRVVEYGYDSMGRRNLEKNDIQTVHYEYDLLDRVVMKQDGIITRYTYDLDGNKDSITVGDITETFAFDPLGRKCLHSTQDGDTLTLYIDESERTLVEIDPLERTTFFLYDKLGRLKKVSKSFEGNLIHEEENFYNEASDLLKHITHVYSGTTYLYPIITEYAYNSLHQCIQMKRGDERITTYTYTPSGNLSSKTYPDGLVVKYAYDEFGHLIELKSNELFHTFRYNSRRILIEARSSDCLVTRTIDPFGNTLSETINGNTLTKTYDALDRPTHITYPDGTFASFDYDSHYLRQANYDEWTHQFVEYDSAGRAIQERLPDQSLLLKTYDDCSRILKISHPRFSQKNDYDACGNLQETEIFDEKRKFSYDPLDQLIKDPHHDYSFDSHYNPLNKVNQLDELLDCTYDLRGNLVQDHCNHYFYDELNRLIKVITPTGEHVYKYDPLHRLIEKDEEVFLWDGSQELGSSNEKRVLHPITSGALFISQKDETHLPIFDACNHLRLLINTSTGEVTEHDYTSFGEPLTEPTVAWEFSSSRYDKDTGLYYNHHRYYNPILKRWLTADPAGFIDSTNLYVYAKNNPNRYCDPTGQFAFLIPLVVWGATSSFVGWGAIALAAIDGALLSAAAVGCYSIATAAYKDNSYTLSGSNILLYDTLYYSQKYNNQGSYILDQFETSLSRGKNGGIDPTLPLNPESHPDWKDISHPQEKEKGGRSTFEHKYSGEKIYKDKGRPGEPGHRGRDHYHRPNPNATGRHDEYLDAKGKPVPDGHDSSHLYPRKN